ncbi:VOC family protein [Anaerovorax odorimutans]|uniref:VOC family protein n=1 Tax=Anaerovorax odorimutans TaxID=109327 RepID=A0ABT1RNB6_9FIRM|nr:VOC family protein [Anaerovorax odorimutans]MCQ4636682.1 VOC family protein [Anaerovorax odorimutans]
MKFEMYHSCITVLDLEKSLAFYEKALGLKPVRTIEAEDGSSKIVFLGTEGNPCQLELTWIRDRKEPYNLGDNEIHIGFRVDDYDAALAYHKEMDCVCFENPKFGVYFIEDPDGYWMEVVPTR